MTGQPPTYDELIREVFIDPIRSVVVVDDQFPTLDRLLDLAASTGGPTSQPIADHSWQIDKAREIVRFCHAPERRWLVEFHDGQPPLDAESQIADHLAQSDLMILDYHLDPSDQEAGAAAIKILRRIACNDHFNLVLVYTKGSTEAGGDIERVWREIVIGLSKADEVLTWDPEGLAAARDIIQELEDQDAGVEYKIRADVDDRAYLELRKACPSGYAWDQLLQDQQCLAPLKTTLDRFPRLTLGRKAQILRWALHERQESLQDSLAPADLGPVRWAPDGSSQGNWIRTDRLFVTVVSKREEPGKLPDLLCKALLGWRPEPHRLLMSKMRTVLAEVGVKAEDGILSNRHLQKAWFDDLREKDEQQRRWKIQATVARQWERLGDALAETVGAYGDKLAAWLLTNPEEASEEVLFQGLDQVQVMEHRNWYVCSKPVTGHYLTTGHVLKIEDSNGGDSGHWLCLTPACDLVPRQRKGWHERLPGYVPFIAVELQADDKEWKKSAHRGYHLFLALDNRIKCFVFTPPGSDAAPKWEQMLASEQGRCDGNFSIKIKRIKANCDKADDPDRLSCDLTIESASARIVAQLRYEYALNLLHRLGATLSRVGLDFASLPRN